MLEGVASVVPISKPYKLASRELKKEDTIVSVGKVKIGGNRIAIFAGPCAVESREQIMSIAESVREAGAVILRGGAFKLEPALMHSRVWERKAFSISRKPVKSLGCRSPVK